MKEQAYYQAQNYIEDTCEDIDQSDEGEEEGYYDESQLGVEFHYRVFQSRQLIDIHF